MTMPEALPPLIETPPGLYRHYKGMLSLWRTVPTTS